MLGNREMMEHFARCPNRPGVGVATVNLDASDAAVTRGRVLDYRESAQVETGPTSPELMKSLDTLLKGTRAVYRPEPDSQERRFIPIDDL